MLQTISNSNFIPQMSLVLSLLMGTSIAACLVILAVVYVTKTNRAMPRLEKRKTSHVTEVLQVIEQCCWLIAAIIYPLFSGGHGRQEAEIHKPGPHQSGDGPGVLKTESSEGG